MQFAGEAGWKKAVEANDDPYGSGVVRYAERWADAMEYEMNYGSFGVHPFSRIDRSDEAAVAAFLADHAERLGHEADAGIGITGFMYGCAVGILSKVWKHGEALRRWHNLDAQIGVEGEQANESGGVLNPALLNIG